MFVRLLNLYDFVVLLKVEQIETNEDVCSLIKQVWPSHSIEGRISF